MIDLNIDKKEMPSFMFEHFANSELELEAIYHRTDRERCQACNHKIKNVYVVKERDTKEVKHMGSECLANRGVIHKPVKSWWEGAKANGGARLEYYKEKERKRKVRVQRKTSNLNTYAKEIKYIEAYASTTTNNFLNSILGHIKDGRELSEKQLNAVHKIMKRTPIDGLAEQVKESEAQGPYIIEMLEKLSKVSFGFHPGGNTALSISRQFAENGKLSNKQVELLEKYVHRFREQIAEKGKWKR